MQARRYRDEDAVRQAQMTGHAVALYLDGWANGGKTPSPEGVQEAIGAE